MFFRDLLVALSILSISCPLTFVPKLLSWISFLLFRDGKLLKLLGCQALRNAEDTWEFQGQARIVAIQSPPGSHCRRSPPAVIDQKGLLFTEFISVYCLALVKVQPVQKNPWNCTGFIGYFVASRCLKWRNDFTLSGTQRNHVQIYREEPGPCGS